MSEAVERAFDYDPFSPAVMQNPHPYYKVMRRDHPAYYSAKYDGFFFSRFEDCVELLSHQDNSLMESEGSLPTPAMIRTPNTGAVPIPPSDPFPMAQRLGMPVYGEVRRAHVKPMMPRDVKHLAGRIREIADARLDVLLPLKTFNLTRDYGGFVSSGTIMHLMGMPEELAERSLDIINSGTRTDPNPAASISGGGARGDRLLPALCRGALRRRRRRRRADGRRDDPVAPRGPPADPSAGRPAAGLRLHRRHRDGAEDAAHGLMELNARPEQMAAVRADLEANVPNAAEEMIRFCAPAQWFMRTCYKPVTIAGTKINPGQRVFFMVGSALRDEREYENPDEFHWDRHIPRTLAFGQGVHFCIGTHLARLEIRILVDAFLRRVPNFSFDMAQAVRPPSSFQWGWNKLPVVIG